MRFLPDGFDSVDELYADDQLGQQVVSVEAAPTVLCRLGEFEDHGERRLVGEASLGSHGTVTADFGGGLISSDGGVVLLREAERRLGLADTLASCIREWRDPATVTSMS